MAEGSERIDASGEAQVLFAGDLDESAVAFQISASSKDSRSGIEEGILIRPDAETASR